MNNVNNSDKFVKVLFFVLSINLFPIVLTSSIIQGLRGSSIYDIIVAGVYSVHVSVILFFLFRRDFVIETKYLYILLSMTVAQTFTLFYSTAINNSVNVFDYFNVLSLTINFIVLVVMPSKLKISRVALLNFFKWLLLIGLIASIYNLLLNFNGIINILNVRNSYSVNYSSFFLNRNSFAQMLFFSTIANTVLYFEFKKYRYLFYYILIAINMFATFSRTSISVTIIFIIVFLLLNYRVNILKKWYIPSMISIILIVLINRSNNYEAIQRLLIRSDMGTTSRSGLWISGLEILDNTSWFFGIGTYSATSLLNLLGHKNSQFHNFYIEILIMGGALLFTIYIYIYGVMFKIYLNIIKNDKIIGSIYIAAFVALLAYGFFESLSFFTIGYVGTIFTIIYITLPLIYSNNIKSDL